MATLAYNPYHLTWKPILSDNNQNICPSRGGSKRSWNPKQIFNNCKNYSKIKNRLRWHTKMI